MNTTHAAQCATARRVLPLAFAAIVAGTVSLPQSVHADPITPPPVPTDIQVEAGHKAFFKAHAFGTQNYVCLPSESGFAWSFFSPQATLFGHGDQQVITHFLSPNLNPDPSENVTPRVTWRHSRDSSTVWARGFKSSDDAAFVAPGAIPWLLVKRAGSQDGPTGGHKLTPTSFIQRLNTAGGVAPETGCSEPADVGKKALVPYEADYFFYKPDQGRY
ncbi:DUF3455 domain-containing protein [Methylococcus sp. EFPC2]|uniref:DUF3455 domain-containing protein n=1 Tax=Methylococcus sp. EFPC2 TaxID=2812648 RepID=UPI001967CED4|nr:DUF3455 domain-containing protein [Methylococcus sp. EFPC2]QSA95629.1 DUF3455 domain-containing protein [Methylococcus sp. EFPC2]